MSKSIVQFVLSLALVCSLAACATNRQKPIRVSEFSRPIRVACVGDSITFGYGLKNRTNESYPARLGAMLGTNWIVGNFGVNGATLLKRGTRPYFTQPALSHALAFEPDVVVIQLGTNDTKKENWGEHKADFVPDYLELISRFSELPTKPRIYLCRPVPLFRDRGKNFDTNQLLIEILPVIDYVGRKSKHPVIDLNAPFEKRPELFPDGVHPNAEGANLIAQDVYTALVGKVARKK